MAVVVATTKYSILADNSITVSLPSGILANDIIDVVVSVRRTGANPTISGYTQISTTSNTFETRRLAKVAAGGEASFTTGNSGTSVSGALWLAQVRIIRFADITGGIAAAYDGTNVGTATATSIASPALTTTADDDLILHDCVFDTVVPVPSSVSALNILMGMGNMAGGVYQQGAYGAVPTFNWLSNASKAASAHVAAVKNAASGTKDIFLVDNRIIVRNYAGYETPTFAVPSSVIATIGSYDTSSGSITPASGNPTAGDWIIPGYSITSTENISGASKWVGVWDTNPTLSNIEGKTVVIPFGFSTTVDSTRIDADGFIVAFADTSNRIAAYQLLAQKDMVPNTALTKFIKPGTTTPYAASGAIDWTDDLKVGYFYLRKTGITTSISVVIGRVCYESSASQIVGGGADFPITAKQVALRMLAGGFYSKAATFNGAGQLISKLSIEYGNGATPTYVKHSGDSIEYPSASDADWLLGDSAASINYKWSSSDTTILSGSIHRTTRRAGFSIDAAASASASVNLVNASFFGPWDFADNLGKDFTGALLNGCYRFTLNNGTYTSLTVENTADTVAVSVAASGATISGSTIDVTGTSADYHLELGTAVTAITLTDVTFTGTPGTDKVHVLKASGTVTITISGTTSLVAGDVTTAGATVVIAAPNPTLSATVLSGSRVVLYNDTTAAELDNTAPAGTSWSKVITSGASSGDTLTLHVFKEGYEEFSTSFIYAGIDNTLLVTQAVHAAIASLRTELSITDYTTITEFTLDITGTVEIDADDADGNTMKARLAIWYNGVLTTENGARYLRGAISVLSTAAIRINVSVLDLLVANVSVTYGLNFTDTDRRLYRSDGTPIYAAASAAGSIQNDYSGVPDTVETGVSGLTGPESAQLMGLPSASAIANQVVNGITFP